MSKVKCYVKQKTLSFGIVDIFLKLQLLNTFNINELIEFNKGDPLLPNEFHALYC